MNIEEAKIQVKELREKLEYYAKLYYDEDNPAISDYEYDMQMNKLKAWEKEFPELKSKDSLTQKVGGHVKEGFKEVTHEVPLLSLQDIFSFDELFVVLFILVFLSGLLNLSLVNKLTNQYQHFFNDWIINYCPILVLYIIFN